MDCPNGYPDPGRDQAAGRARGLHHVSGGLQPRQLARQRGHAAVPTEPLLLLLAVVVPLAVPLAV